MKNNKSRGRHELKQERQFRNMAIVTLIITCAICVTGWIISKNYRSPDHEQPAHMKTDAEIMAFWTNEMEEIIGKELVLGKLPYPILNDSFNSLNAATVDRTGHTIAVTMSTKYHWASTNVQAATGITSNGAVSIELYIPAFADSFDSYRSSGQPDWRNLFQAHAIAIFMHEMEHASCGITTNHISIGEESRAWAETCRHTLVPMADIYRLGLTTTEGEFYVAWKESFGDTNNIHWIALLDKLYGSLDGRSNH